MTATEQLFKEILHQLSPETLRQKIELPHEAIREEFVPRFLSTTSYEQMLDELTQFVAHVRKHWLTSDVEWPRDYDVAEARRFLAATIGEHAAMKAVRHGDQGGMRALLDMFTGQLQAESLGRYLEICVLPPVERLLFEESLALAQAYLDEFKLPGLEREQPTGIVGRWRAVIYQHAQLVTGSHPQPPRVLRGMKGRSKDGYIEGKRGGS